MSYEEGCCKHPWHRLGQAATTRCPNCLTGKDEDKPRSPYEEPLALRGRALDEIIHLIEHGSGNLLIEAQSRSTLIDFLVELQKYVS